MHSILKTSPALYVYMGRQEKVDIQRIGGKDCNSGIDLEYDIDNPRLTCYASVRSDVDEWQ